MKKLVTFITSSYPEKSFTIDLALALSQNGVDSLELGVPFSDPVADGPLIEKASHKSLELGFRFEDLLFISKEISSSIDTLWMGYFNSFYQQNLNNLLPLAKEIGISGMIVPDLPYEEADKYLELFKNNNISNISFVAPTDSEARIKEIVTKSQKFIYMVAYAGITGSAKSENLSESLYFIKKYTSTPIYVGFGVDANTAKDKVKGADGVIVGSAFVEILLDDKLNYSQKIDRCCKLSKLIKNEINS